MRQQALLVGLLLVAACGPQEHGRPSNIGATNDAVPARRTTQVAAKSEGNAAAGIRDADSNTAEAAAKIVQDYGALIEQSRWNEARALWSDAKQADAFEAQLGQFADVHLEIGNPGEPEGAAGSIYVTTPVFFYGDDKVGQPLRRSADVTLRRVNDVPGSTEDQRRWHIEQIDFAR